MPITYGPPPPTIPPGLPPNTYAGLTFWYEANNSPHYGQSGGQDTVVSDDEGDPVYRFDSLGGINRVFYSSTSGQLIGAPGVRALDSSAEAINFGMHTKPAAGAPVTSVLNADQLVTASTKVVIAAVRLNNAFAFDTIGGNSYSLNAVLTHSGRYFGLFYAGFQGKVVFEAYNWDGAEDRTGLSPTIELGETAIVTLVHRSGRVKLRLNGVEVGDVASGSTTTGTLASAVELNSVNVYPREADMELLGFCAYNASRSDAEILEVERYFAAEAGLTLATAPTSPPFDYAKRGWSSSLSPDRKTARFGPFLNSTVLSTVGYTTGKRYFEVSVDALGTIASIGVSRAGAPADYTSDLGQEAGEYGWYHSGNSYFAGAFGGVTGASFAAGDVVGVAVDFGTRRVWWRINGTWIGSGNPAAGTGQQVTYATGLGTIFAAVSANDGARLTLRTKSSEFSGSIPTGFSAWE